MSTSTYTTLVRQFPHLEFLQNAPLAPFTTVKIGGPAEVLWIAKNRDELRQVAQFCLHADISFTILGWGANTLIADTGLSGLVIINQTREITVLSDTATADAPHDQPGKSSSVDTRWHPSSQQDISQLFNYYTGEEPVVRVQIESGAPLPFAINSLYQQGITGLEYFTRIPATLGGAIYNNIHGADTFIGQLVESVEIISEQGLVSNLSQSELEFAYDYSRFHQTHETILSAILRLAVGPVELARSAGMTWASRKKHQPQQSLGCVFQNISAETQASLNLPSPSIGFLIDKVLNLSDYQIGDARIAPAHAAFIENLGSATAADYLSVVAHIVQQAKRQLGLTLELEIFLKGFSSDQLVAVGLHQKDHI